MTTPSPRAALPMAIDTATLFARIGRLGKLLYTVQSAQAALPAAFTSLYTSFGSAYPDLDGSVAARQDGAIRGLTGWWATPAAAARDLILRTVQADSPAAARTFPEAIGELRRQMVAAGDTVKACAVAASAAALAGSVGSGVVVLSVKRGDGLAQEHVAAEVARLVCTADSYSGGATAGREAFALVGTPQAAGGYDADWPTGSGASAGLTAVSAAEDASAAGNLLTNGDFGDWTASPLRADYWYLSPGIWETDAVQSFTTVRADATCSLRLAAGATLTALYQQFGSSISSGAGSGTSAVMVPYRSYAVNLWLRTVAGTASAGVLTVDLVDGSGAVVADAQGVSNSFAVTLSTLTTAWVAENGVFRLPASPPATLLLRLRLSTALAGADVLVDDVCLTPLTAAYPGGPALAVFGGATPFVAGDGWALTATNARGGASYGATWQTLFLRLTQDPTFLLPSTSGTPTLLDSLITS